MRTDQAIDITLPIGFPFPNIGRLLAMIFIPFGAWFVGQPLPFVDYPMLVLAGLPSFFAKVTIAVPFLSEPVPSTRRSFSSLSADGYRQRSRVIAGRRHAPVCLHRHHRSCRDRPRHDSIGAAPLQPSP